MTPLRALVLGFALVLGTASSGAWAAADAAGSDCVSCHTKRGITGSALRDFSMSRHAAQGMTCAACHLSGETPTKTSACEKPGVVKAVSAKVCAPCHAAQVEQFGKGKHSKAWVAMTAMPTTKDQPKALMEGMKGCGGCHRIGSDGGKCDSCHTRHTFSAAEARRPEACATCHMGFDHPQWEMYSTSKHGILVTQNAWRWDWEKGLGDWFKEPAKADATTPRAPTCAFCHMPSGDHGVRTAWGFLALRLPEDDEEWMADRVEILKALGVLDQAGKPTARLDVVKAGDVARLSKEEWNEERGRMEGQCVKCHAPATVKAELAKGDEIVRAGDRLMAEAIREVSGLYRDGVLPEPKDRPFHVDLLRFYEVEHPVEQKLYVMLMEHRMRNFQGAFHMNPDYQHWYGWAEMKRDMAEIKAEAKALRAEHGKRAGGKPRPAAAGNKKAG